MERSILRRVREVGSRIASATELLMGKTAALQADKEQLEQEIARREEVEAALRESEARLQAIIDQASTVVYVKDVESRFQLVNRKFEEITGLTREEVRGRTSVDLFGPEAGATLLDHDREVLRSGVACEFEETIRLKGSDRVYLSLKFPMLDANRRPYAICGMSSDITGRKAAEMELRSSRDELETRVAERTSQLEETNALLRQEIRRHLETADTLRRTEEQYLHAQKLEALGLLASGVAHDFNNILTAIMGYGTVLLEELPVAERDTSHIAEILRAAERAAGLSKQLLTFSRRQAYQPVLLDLSAIVRDVEKMLRQVIGDRVVLETDLAQNIGSVEADRGYIEQVLLNLVVNARDAMPGDGTIVIGTRAVSLRPHEVKIATAERDFITLSVRDNGSGIPPEVMARMFEPFFTTKRAGQGTGLGLATCVALAEQSGGWLDCDSTVGAGTEFTLYLPRVNQPAEPADPEGHERASRRGSETILVVEDEPVVGDVLALLLRNLGYDVIRAENGEAAELAVTERGAAAIDLVLTDLNMPRMNGRELVDRLARANPQLKVLLTSGNDELIDERTAAELQVDFLPKPFTMHMLAAKVRAVLDS
jgi:PAS domain S-box-containing protein